MKNILKTIGNWFKTLYFSLINKKIALKDIQQLANDGFVKLDTNHDGFISIDEIIKGLADKE